MLHVYQQYFSNNALQSVNGTTAPGLPTSTEDFFFAYFQKAGSHDAVIRERETNGEIRCRIIKPGKVQPGVPSYNLPVQASV